MYKCLCVCFKCFCAVCACIVCASVTTFGCGGGGGGGCGRVSECECVRDMTDARHVSKYYEGVYVCVQVCLGVCEVFAEHMLLVCSCIIKFVGGSDGVRMGG
jgi:hypothetical protein